MSVRDIYNEENIGMPLKWVFDDGIEKTTYLGRFYGLGFNGESTRENYDSELVYFVMPNNQAGDLEWFFLDFELTAEELVKLEELEKKEEKPYGLYFDIKDGKYIKNYGYRKDPLPIDRFPAKWYKDQGLFEVETDALGNALAELFTKVYGQEYYYQRLDAKCEDENPAYCGRERASRCMRVISQTKYENHIYSETKCPGYYRQPVYNDHGILQPDLREDTIFRHAPVEMKDGEFLLYFDYRWDPKTIEIGIMTDTLGNEWSGYSYKGDYVFTPNRLFTGFCKEGGEVHYDNRSFHVVPQFLQRIIDYKLAHNKIRLDENDMKTIVDEFVTEYKPGAKTQKIVLSPEAKK